MVTSIEELILLKIMILGLIIEMLNLEDGRLKYQIPIVMVLLTIFSDTSSWKRFEWNNLQYVSALESNWYLNADYGYWLIPTTSNYKDYNLFSTAPTTSGVQSNYENIYKNKFDGNNTNIITNSNTVFFGNYFYNNTIGDYFYNNTIGINFNYNTIGNYFYNNTIGNNFYSNTIGDSFYNNTIGNNFSSNTIGDSFYNNTIGDYFFSNTFMSGFNSNTIGDEFSNNTIGYNFNSNTIGNYFQYNTICDNFNAIGSSDFTTYVYQPYNKELFTNSDNEQYLRYYDGNNVLQIVQAIL